MENRTSNWNACYAARDGRLVIIVLVCRITIQNLRLDGPIAHIITNKNAKDFLGLAQGAKAVLHLLLFLFLGLKWADPPLFTLHNLKLKGHIGTPFLRTDQHQYAPANPHNF